MRAFGSAKRRPFCPAASSSDPIEAASPRHIVDTCGRTNCMVSQIASPEVTIPPGELIYIEISFFGFSASRNSSSDVVVDRAGNEDDALLQKPRIDVVGALATIGLLDHHRNELVLVGIARISHVASFGHADRHQRKFLAV